MNSNNFKSASLHMASECGVFRRLWSVANQIPTFRVKVAAWLSGVQCPAVSSLTLPRTVGYRLLTAQRHTPEQWNSQLHAFSSDGRRKHMTQLGPNSETWAF